MSLFLLGCTEEKNITYLINNRWNIELPFQIISRDVIKNELNSRGYIIVKVSKEHISELLKINILRHGYTEWTTVRDRFIIDDINIDGKYFVGATYKNSGKLQIKGIFINEDENIIVFVDYNWSGY